MRTLKEEDYLLANGTVVGLAPLQVGTSTPSTYTITTSAIAASEATSLSVTALTVKLYADTILKFGTQVVTLTQDAEVGATTLNVAPLNASIPSGATAATKALVPLYSVSTTNVQIGENVINSRNYQSGLWQTKKVTMRDASIPCSGTFVRNDPGYILIKNYAKSRNKLYFEIIEPDGSGDKGTAFITGFSRNRPTDQNVEVSFTLNVDGELEDVVSA